MKPSAPGSPDGTPHRLRALHNAAKEIGLLGEESEIAVAAVRHAREALAADRAVLFLAPPDAPDRYRVAAALPTAMTTETCTLDAVSVNLHCIVHAGHARCV